MRGDAGNKQSQPSLTLTPRHISIRRRDAAAAGRRRGVAAELVSVNCNAFWPIRDYTMK